MAEAFCRWDDERTGINPFVPDRVKSYKNIFTAILSSVFGVIIFAIKLPIIVVLTILFCISWCLELIMPINFLKRFIWKFMTSLIVRILLFVLGIFNIRESYAEKRILRIRSETDPRTRFTTIKTSQIIISNFVGYVQILVYIAKVSDCFGFVNEKGDIVTYTGVKAILQAIKKTPILEKGVSIEEASRKAYTPLIVFPEIIPTNGKGILLFKALNKSTDSMSNYNLMGVQFDGSLIIPTHSTSTILRHFLYLLFQLQSNAKIIWLSNKDLNLLPSSEDILNTYRGLLASMLGVEPLELGETEGRNFLKYFESRTKKDKRV
ncbi:hypothetical protein WA158_003862 [Blastocystis sp. Blastoise]